MPKGEKGHIDIFKHHRSIRMYDAKTVKEKWPHVSSINLDLTFFEDWPSPGGPIHQVLDLGPSNKAFFQLNCPYEDCHQGGFDLTKAVTDTIENFESQYSGESMCPGIIMICGHTRQRCLLELKFSIKVAYLDKTQPRS